MAKTKPKTSTTETKEAKPKAAPEVSLEKYIQLNDPPIHKYTRAALYVDFHGIIKTEDQWAEELKEHTRGA